ncbi:MAG: hypothetical protein SGPRY_012752 [Prymnesium sp.]
MDFVSHFSNFAISFCRDRLLRILPKDDLTFQPIREALETEIESIRGDLHVLRHADLEDALYYFQRGWIFLMLNTADNEAFAAEQFEKARDSAISAFSRVKSFEDHFLAARLSILCDHFLLSREARKEGLTEGRRQQLLDTRNTLIQATFQKLYEKSKCSSAISLSMAQDFRSGLSRWWQGRTLKDILTLTHEAVAVCQRYTGIVVEAPTRDGTLVPWSRLLQPLTFTGHSGGVKALALDPAAERVYSGSGDGTIRVWRLDAGHQGECSHTFTGHSGWVKALALDPAAERLYSGGDDGTIRVWRLDAGHQGECSHTFTGHNGWVKAIALDPAAERLYSGSGDRTIRVWSPTDMMFVPRRSANQRDVEALLNRLPVRHSHA